MEYSKEEWDKFAEMGKQIGFQFLKNGQSNLEVISQRLWWQLPSMVVSEKSFSLHDGKLVLPLFPGIEFEITGEEGEIPSPEEVLKFFTERVGTWFERESSPDDHTTPFASSLGGHLDTGFDHDTGEFNLFVMPRATDENYDWVNNSPVWRLFFSV
ncbi:hypothetical protein C4565_00305 [Candidatus Parcubacteria bacterium]|nr:MAG: hypothetical protein C4565_00305 [Candidatus Parcubacteria bacterium]